MQTKDELEAFYANEDPWEYKVNPYDAVRKQRILEAVQHKQFHSALDIGAGEGFITKDLPANYLYAIELSDTAAARLPDNIQRISEPKRKYSLIVASGVLYQQYDNKTILDWIRAHAGGIVVTCNIHGWEINDLPRSKLVSESYFPYRQYIQHLVVYDFTPQHRAKAE